MRTHIVILVIAIGSIFLSCESTKKIDAQGATKKDRRIEGRMARLGSKSPLALSLLCSKNYNKKDSVNEQKSYNPGDEKITRIDTFWRYDTVTKTNVQTVVKYSKQVDTVYKTRYESNVNDAELQASKIKYENQIKAMTEKHEQEMKKQGETISKLTEDLVKEKQNKKWWRMALLILAGVNVVVFFFRKYIGSFLGKIF